MSGFGAPRIRNDKPKTLVRDVITADGKRRKAGIYTTGCEAAETIVPGAEYMAKFDRAYHRVRAGDNGKMYPIETSGK